jgi:hypothetical protein
MAITKEINVVVKEQGIEDVTKKVDGLTKSTENLSDSQSKNKKSSKLNTEAISEIAPATTSAVQSLLTMGKAMWAIVSNPIGLILTAIVGVIALLVASFRTFQPLIDKVEQGFAALQAVINVIKNTFIQVVTGAKSLGDAFSGLGSDISDATKRTIALTKAQQDLEDAMKSQEVTTAKQRAEITKLNVMAKNRNLTEKERLDLLNKAESIEKKLFDKRVALADQEVRNAREAIAIKAGFNSKEIKLLKEQGDATKELAESKGGLYDEEYDRLNKARIARIELEDEATSNLEKNFNKQEALAQKQQDAIDRANEKRIEANEKAKQDRIKSEEDAAKALEESIKKDAQRLYDTDQQAKQDVADLNEFKNAQLEEQAKKEEEAGANKILRLQGEYDAEKKLADERIRNEELVRDAKFQIANSVFDLVNMFAKKGSKLSKGVAAAQATMNTYQGITAALAAPSTVPEPFGTALKIANSVSIGAMGFMNVKKILSTNEQGGGGGNSSGGGSAPQAPSFNLVQGTGSNQIASSIGKQQPIEAYVVGRNVTSSQELDRNIVKSASL